MQCHKVRDKETFSGQHQLCNFSHINVIIREIVSVT